MLLHITLVIVSITLFIGHQNGDKDCDAGWFGFNCSFKCHCADASSCDENGACVNNKSCALGYFGPSCQYANLLSWSTFMKVSENNYLTDLNESTCNTEDNATSVQIILKREYRFSWFRLYVNNEDSLYNFTTILNDDVECSNERKFSVAKLAVDVTCDTNVMIKKIRIEGAVAPDVCSVYFSAGRNLALKQETWQSSNCFDKPHECCQSSNAVNGIIYHNDCCSRTNIFEINHEWHLTFTNASVLYSAVLYVSHDADPRLKGFILMISSINGFGTAAYKDRSKKAQQFYHIVFSTTVQSVMNVVIKSKGTYATEENVLNLCEVETYGDIQCPIGTYGLLCTETCNCSQMEACNYVTGACAQGCQNGFYGMNCGSRCQKNCLDMICEYYSGACLQCQDGYTGDYCDIPCPAGTYGQECGESCHDKCGDRCNETSRHCDCLNKFTGNLCQDCVPGLHGDECLKRCSNLCTKSLCDQKTGDCVSCLAGRLLPYCEECPNGMYGSQCELTCPTACMNHTCNIETGNCFACAGGYEGEQCTKIGENTPPSVWLLAIPVIMSLNLACCIGYWRVTTKVGVQTQNNVTTSDRTIDIDDDFSSTTSL